MQSGKIIIRGIVQGVGFRPFVYACAETYHITGTVINHGSEVEIDAWGDEFDSFLAAVSKGPKMSVIDSVETLPLSGEVPASFIILPSRDGARTGFVPADIATCKHCLEDVMNPESRYYGYWATSCTDCGPRYSIIHTVPYDRERTAMHVLAAAADRGHEVHSRSFATLPVALTPRDPETRNVDERVLALGGHDDLLDAIAHFVGVQVVLVLVDLVSGFPVVTLLRGIELRPAVVLGIVGGDAALHEREQGIGAALARRLHRFGRGGRHDAHQHRDDADHDEKLDDGKALLHQSTPCVCP